MRAGRYLESDDNPPQRRVSQPMRHHAPQDTPIAGKAALGPALAGNDQKEPRLAGMLAMQEAEQGLVRLGLPHAMQVNPRIRHTLAPREFAQQLALDTGQRQ